MPSNPSSRTAPARKCATARPELAGAGLVRRWSTRWLAPLILLAGAAPAMLAAQAATPVAPPATIVRTAPPLVAVEVVARFPHDPAAFTQGLIADGDRLIESTGRPGQSEVRRVDLATGRVLMRRAIPASQFGEGLARVGDTLFSLTWQHGIAHRWDAQTLRPRGRLRSRGEGWGLATMGRELILSDGSADLSFRDPASFAERRRITVRANGREIRNLNELEVVEGRIWANVWMTGFILVIDPADGAVTHVLDLRPLVAEIGGADPDAVLNGIAYDAATRRLFVTGKLWPTMFEIRVPALD